MKHREIAYGLLGHPLTHSFSKAFFTELFAGMDAGLSYSNFDLPELTHQSLYHMLLMNPQLRGFNVTAPYKRRIMEFLDTVDPEAAEVGAVNTVVVERHPSGALKALRGFNTDVAGFRESIEPMLADIGPAAGALILGTGGASDAAAYVFRHMGRPFLKVSRAKGGAEGVIGYEDITPELLERFPIVVNCTPAGTYPNVDTCPPFPYALIRPGMVFFDMVYNPDPSLFLARADAMGAATKSGAEMLVLQALEAWRIWCDHQTDEI